MGGPITEGSQFGSLGLNGTSGINGSLPSRPTPMIMSFGTNYSNINNENSVGVPKKLNIPSSHPANP